MQGYINVNILCATMLVETFGGWEGGGEGGGLGLPF